LVQAGFTANYYYGIRRFPKAVIAFTGGANNRPHNPLTFRHLNSNCNTEIGTATTIGTISAFPRGPIGVTQCDQVHNAGEVWSSALWEVRAKMIARLGAAAGNRKTLQLVTDGMKLAPLNPTFLQERNAILAAAQASSLNEQDAAADVADVWAGFALRGMGFTASITTASPAVVTEAFDLPNVVIATTGFTVTDPAPGGDGDGFPEPGETVTLTVPVTNSTGSTVNNVSVGVTGGSTATYGNIDNAATVTRTLTYLVPATAACGSLHTVTLNISSSVGMRSETRQFRLGAPVGGPPTTAQNTAAITINDNAPATPYPSNITVAGVPAGNFKVKMTLTGLTHTFPGDVDVLLVNPSGQALVVMSDIGGADDVTNINVTIDDAAANPLPTSALTTGTYRPTNTGAADPFPAPAPATRQDPAPAGTATMASVFGAGPYNGQWSLFIVDDAGIDVGTVSGGWSITFESNNFNCSFASNVRSRADFDGDGRTDISVFRNGIWYLQRSQAGFAGLQWGTTGDQITSGKWDADTREDVAVFRPVAPDTTPDWWILPSTGTPYAFRWGTTGDIAVENDYDGDGRVDAAVFRPSNNTWYILRSGGGTTTTVFGQTGDIPVPVFFDADNRADLAVYRAGSWVIQPSGGGAQQTIAWGAAGNIPVAADYNNDNVDDLAVYEPNTGIWRIRLSGAAGGTRVFAWGQTGDVPVPGDYNGDGADEIAIYRNGTWYINSGTGGLTVAQFGLAADSPIPRSYLP
jgi:subtilisin-like proprotein convertase family protein